MDCSYLEATRPAPACSRDPAGSCQLYLKAGIKMERRSLSLWPLPMALCSAGRRSRRAGTEQSEPAVQGVACLPPEGVAGRPVRVP